MGRTVALPAKFAISDNLSGLLIATTLGLSVLLVCVYLFVYKSAVPEPKSDNPRATVHDCIVETQSLSKIQINNLNDYIGLYNLCNDQIFRNYEYNDFAVRREKFVRQELDERVKLMARCRYHAIWRPSVRCSASYVVQNCTFWQRILEQRCNLCNQAGRDIVQVFGNGSGHSGHVTGFFRCLRRLDLSQQRGGGGMGVPVPFPTGQQLPPGGLGPPPGNEANKAETMPPAPAK